MNTGIAFIISCISYFNLNTIANCNLDDLPVRCGYQVAGFV